MFHHLKKYSLFLFVTLLLNSAFSVVQLNAKSTVTNESVNNTQSVETKKIVVKKPTFKETWHKVLTLRWNQLGRSDLRNIGKPIITIAVLGGLYYFWPKDNGVHAIFNNNNAGNNGGNGIPPVNSRNNNNNLDLDSSDSDSSSEDDLDDNPGDVGNTIRRPIIIATNAVDKKIVNFCNNEMPVNDIQHKIALNMISDFFVEPEILQANNGLIFSVAMQGDKIVVGSNNIMIWDKNTGALLHTLQGTGPVAIQSNKVVGVSTWSIPKIWDANTGVVLRELLGYVGSVKFIKISTDGNTVVWGGINDIQIWDANGGQLLRKISVNKTPFQINSLVIINSLAIQDDKIIIGLQDGAIMIGNINTGVLVHSMIRHAGAITSIATQDDIVVTVACDGTAKIWNSNTGLLLHRLRGQFTSAVIQDNKVITGSLDNTVKIWNANTGVLLHTLQGHTSFVNAVAIQDNLVISGSSDGTARRWSLDVDFNAPELYDNNDALNWIKKSVMPMQANLITRAAYAGNAFLIFSNTDDARIWVTFPEHVRQYLMERLNIRLSR